ncbi:zinc finger, GRF-type containing protein [Tanacetum coccineum]
MVCCACGLEAVIRTSWTNQNPGRRFYGCPTLNPNYTHTYLYFLIPFTIGAARGFVHLEELMQTQREAQQANELSNLTRQRQLLANVNYRRAIIQELERLPGNLVACKTREHLKCIQKAVFVEVIELKKQLCLQVLP